MLSIGKIGVAHAAYFMSRAAAGIDLAGRSGRAGRSGQQGSYYTGGGEKQGVWAAAGSMGVSAGAAVTPEQLTAMLSGIDPGTGNRLGHKIKPGGTFTDRLGIVRNRKPVSAFDLTFSLPKSVSAAWALADGPVRREIEGAWSHSVDAVVAYVQRRGVMSRSGAGGKTIEDVPGGATIARFDHFTSRAGDPQLHSHLLVANKVLCGDGVWRNLHGQQLYASAKAASMVGGAVLRAELSRRLGWSWDRIDDRLHADLAGSPKDLIEAWSSRSRDVAREAGRRVRKFEATTGREPTPDERIEIWNQAAVSSRQSKSLLPLEGDPHERWRAEAAELGIDADEVVDGYWSARRLERDVYDRPEVVIDGMRLALHGDLVDQLVAAAEDSATSLSDVDLDAAVYAAINAGPGCAAIGRPGSEFVDAAANALRERLEARLVFCGGRWWSPGLIAAEQAVAAWLASPAPEDVAADRIDLEGLGQDQAEAAAALVASTSTGSVLIGPAGAGKTTALARIAAAVGHDRVVAAAPTAVAAATLGAALGTPSSTVALINVSQSPLPHRGWVIIDEAGQLATRDLAAVCGRAAVARARVLLVGDPAQQGSVAAGGVFDALAASDVLCTSTLNQLWRFDDPAEAKATAAVHRGQRSGLDYHAANRRITDSSHADAAAVATDWWQAHRGRTTVISAPTSALMRNINAEIAGRRAAGGETGRVVCGDGDRAIRIGDIVTTRQNHRHHRADDGAPVRNGDRWTVTDTAGGGELVLGQDQLASAGGIGDGPPVAVSHRGAVVGPVRNGDRWTVTDTAGGGELVLAHLDRQATIALPGWYAATHIDLGYAVTQTRAQSITVDASMTVVTSSSSRDQLYVGLTRGKKENHLHIVTDQPAHDPETAPAHTTPQKIIDAVFSRRHGWATATDLTSPALSAAQAADHLALVAATGAGRCLPPNEHLDPASLVARRDVAAQRARADDIDDHIASGIDDWLAGICEYDAQSAYVENQEMKDMENQLLERLEAVEPYDNPWDGPRPDDAIVANSPDAGAGPPAPVCGPEAADPPEWRPTLGAIRRARGLLDDDFRYLGWDATAQIDRATEHAAVAGHFDNPWLVQLFAAYQRADRRSREEIAPVLAAVADPPARQRIEALAGCEPLQGHTAQWATDVRAAVAARRRARHRDTLDELTRARADKVAAAAGDAAARLAAADQNRWHKAVEDWLDNGCGTRQLAAAWEQAAKDAADDLWDHANTDHPPADPTPEAPAARPPNTPEPPPPMSVAEIAASARRSPATPQRASTDRTLPEAEAVAAAAGWYHDQLLNSPGAAAARAYLRSRGITEDQWDKWQLGWAPDQWQALAAHLARTGIDADAAVASGVLGETRGRCWDFLRGRVVFPIRDADGTPIALAGRLLKGDAHKYLNTRNNAIYQKSDALYGIDHAADAIAATGEAVVVEGYTDAIAAHAAGIANTVAACGTAFGEGHLQTLHTACGHPGLLTIALDADAAGAQAAETTAGLAARHAIHSRTARLPEGKDPADLEPDELRRAIGRALPRPWQAIPDIAATSSISEKVKAATTAVRQAAATDTVAGIIAACEIANTSDVTLQYLLDHAQQTAERPQPAPVRTSRRPTADIGL